MPLYVMVRVVCPMFANTRRQMQGGSRNRLLLSLDSKQERVIGGGQLASTYDFFSPLQYLAYFAGQIPTTRKSG